MVLGFTAVTFVSLLVFRMAFFALFLGTASITSTPQLLHSLYVGTKFDLRLTLLIALPALLLAWLPWPRGLRASSGAGLFTAYFVLGWAVIAFVHFVDFAHYDYLQVRLDSSVFEHLAAPDIALEMVWGAYPVLWLMLGLAVVVSAYAWCLRRIGRVVVQRELAPRGRGAGFASIAITFLLIAAGIYGKASFYPLRWSDAYASQERFTTALALNPTLQLVDTWKHRQRAFDIEKARAHYGVVAEHLGVQGGDPASLAFQRSVAGDPARAASRPNIVIVLCESLAAFKVGCLGNELDPTPRFDALASEGLLFDRFFVPSGPTARSVFSAVTSVADVTPSDTASRNPLMINQRSLFNEFEGYEKHYFLGGSASWGNIRGVLEHNVPDLQLHEEGDYDAPRADVWGISDLDLMREANAVLAQVEGPFVAFLQTSGNHSPWTIPEEHGEFELVTGIEDQVLRDAGFPELIDHYNAVRFLDYSIGELVELAKGEAYFEDTIFFFFGDHGTAFPATTARFPALTQHNVPLLVYGPKLLGPPRLLHTVGSSLDVFPTAAALAGLEHRNSSMGRDLFSDAHARSPYAFLRLGGEAGLVGPEFQLQVLPDGSKKLFAYDSAEPDLDLASEEPEAFERMGALATGLFETASYMLYRDNGVAQ